jgi:hypothetical protein
MHAAAFLSEAHLSVSWVAVFFCLPMKKVEAEA